MQSIDSIEDDNVDALIFLEDDSSYTATFFTIKNIQSTMDRYRDTGECLSGDFFWAKNMVVLKDLSSNTIDRTVRELIDSGEYISAFELLSL
jgi:hypothetical protein